MATNLARRFESVESGEPEIGSSAVGHTANPNVCGFCYGSGMEVVPGKGARRCRCRNEERRARLFEAANIPRRHAVCSLESYKPAKGNGSQLLAFNYAFRLVREYPAVDRGLLFMGTVGVGKTHLSVAILCGLVEKGVPCLFYEFGSLFTHLTIAPTGQPQTHPRRAGGAALPTGERVGGGG
jgi:DNA replication protein DnaC